MIRQTNQPVPKQTGSSNWEIVLVLINLILVVNGIIFFVVMVFLLKWGAERNQGGNEVTLNNAYAAKNFFVYNVPIMFLSSLSIIVSLTGFVKKKIKQDLIIIYKVFVSVFFGSHLILCAYALVLWPYLENNYRASLKETVKIISEQRNEYPETECGYMRKLSQQFSCCGYDAEDANVVGWKELCCTVNANSSGCLQPSLDRIKVYHIWFFITPSGFGLLCELVLLYYVFEVNRKRYPPQDNRADNFCMENR
jgi:hypothetical protein